MSYMSSHTEELWYNKTVDDYTYIYIGYDGKIVVLNYAKMKITLTFHFIRYIYNNFMKISWNTTD